MNKSKIPTTYSQRPIDLWLIGSIIILIVIGLLMVLDSSYTHTLDKDPYQSMKHQALGMLGGFGGLILMLRIGYKRLSTLAIPIMILGLLLLVSVFIPHIRDNSHSVAYRWIKLGPIKFQPSEFAKLCLIVYMAKVLSRPQRGSRKRETVLGNADNAQNPSDTLPMREFNSRNRNKSYPSVVLIAAPLIIALIYFGLIEREPDLGTSFVLFLAIMSQLFLSGIRLRDLYLMLGGIGLALFGVICFGKHGIERILTWLNPERYESTGGYQIIHSMRAVGSGGWLGVGLGRGREKYYLPEFNTDFIFATISEELGFLGVLVILGLLFIVGYRAFQIALNAEDRFGSLLAGGIAALISWQTLINVAVVTGSIPATGVPLPFISFGSSSLISLMMAVGILLSISMDHKRTLLRRARPDAARR